MRKNGPVSGGARLLRNAPNSAVAKNNAAANVVKPINASPINVTRIKVTRHVSPSSGR